MGHATESNNKGKKTRQNSWKYFLKHVRTMYQGTVEFKLYSHPKIPLVPTIDFRVYVSNR